MRIINPWKNVREIGDRDFEIWVNEKKAVKDIIDIDGVNYMNILTHSIKF